MSDECRPMSSESAFASLSFLLGIRVGWWMLQHTLVGVILQGPQGFIPTFCSPEQHRHSRTHKGTVLTLSGDVQAPAIGHYRSHVNADDAHGNRTFQGNNEFNEAVRREYQ